MKTKNEIVIEAKGTHNHECYPAECKAKEVMNQIKRRAQYSTPTVAIANEIYEISDNYAVRPARVKASLELVIEEIRGYRERTVGRKCRQKNE